METINVIISKNFLNHFFCMNSNKFHRMNLQSEINIKSRQAERTGI